MPKVILLLLFLSVLRPSAAFADEKPLNVVVTFSILGDMTQQIGAETVVVTSLVGADGDVHTYKPTPRDVKNLANADVVIENGLGLEGWMDRLISASGYKGPIVIASRGVTPRQMTAAEDENVAHAAGGVMTDPHAWQDISNARIYAHNIETALMDARSPRAKIIAAEAQAYDAQLQKLDEWIKQQIAEVPPAQRKVITSHDAFGYFGAAYGVTFMAPQGISTEVEPTATDVGKLIDQMKAEKVKRVFFENMASPKLISQIAKDADASVGKPIYSDALSSPDGPAATFVKMFYYNVAQFKAAMLLNGS